MTTFAWAEGTRSGGVKPEVAAAELARIRQEQGGLSAPLVVQEAEPEDAPLHPAFEWDDSEAAREYRLIQARQLIRAVVRLSDAEGEPPRRVWVHVSRDSYEPIDAVVSMPDAFRLALGELERRLASADRAVEELRWAATRAPQPVRRQRAVKRAARGVSLARDAVAALGA